jgi:hypothetical protein
MRIQAPTETKWHFPKTDPKWETSQNSKFYRKPEISSLLEFFIQNDRIHQLKAERRVFAIHLLTNNTHILHISPLHSKNTIFSRIRSIPLKLSNRKSKHRTREFPNFLQINFSYIISSIIIQTPQGVKILKNQQKNLLFSIRWRLAWLLCTRFFLHKKFSSKIQKTRKNFRSNHAPRATSTPSGKAWKHNSKPPVHQSHYFVQNRAIQF